MNIFILIIFLIFLCIVAFLVYQQINSGLVKSDNIYNLKNSKNKLSTQNHLYIYNWLKDVQIQNEEFAKLKSQISKNIYGMDHVINAMIIWLITGNHILLSWYPWLAKTTSINSFSKLLGLDSGRVQGSVDLQPSDIIGQNIYNPSTNQLETKLWPIYHNIVLVDEINRMTPKAQSALLQVMAENTITIDNKLLDLPKPFMVLATMNPHDDYGTFPMSAANLDRFAIWVYIDRPSSEDEKLIISSVSDQSSFDDLENWYNLTSDFLRDINQQISNIYISDNLQDLILSIISKTRNHENIKIWLGPRASIYISTVSKSIARLEWSKIVTDRHIYMSLSSVLFHRLNLTHSGIDKYTIIYELA